MKRAEGKNEKCLAGVIFSVYLQDEKSNDF